MSDALQQQAAILARRAGQPQVEKFHTIDGLLRSHAEDPDDVSLVCYPVSGVADYEEHTAKQIDMYVDAACDHYIRSGLKPADPLLENAPVVALLTPSNFEVVITIFALNRLGWAVLFLSTRLTAPAYARLLELAGCNTIIASPAYAVVVEEIQRQVPCLSVPFLKRNQWKGRRCPPFQRRCEVSKESQKNAWIIHSSGSTGFPKPIFLSNYACLANFRKTFALRTFCTSPLFHSHALMELFRAFYGKAPMYLNNYAFPITSQNLIRALSVAKPELISVVPYVLKLLAETATGIAQLARARLVLFAGSSCPDDLGDVLTAKGVNLIANYGATETGQIMTSFRPPGDTEWNYLRLQDPVAQFTLMDEISPGIFECVALDGLPSKGPSNSDSPPNSFRTRDLFTRHPNPQKSNHWKFVSRLDDRITLVNGEKILPIPIEGHIRRHELVQEAAVFGFERSVPGVFLFKSPQAAVLSDEEFLHKVWPVVEAANAKAETFSRIPRELIVVMPADTAYPKTDKGTFIRAQLYQQFAAAIDDAYGRFEAAEGEASTAKLSLEIPGLEAFLFEKFRTELNVHLENVHSDIFAAGVDSLQTTRMWHVIKQNLELGSAGRTLSQNVVFEAGNVASLAQHLFALRTGCLLEGYDEISLMKELIARYSAFETHHPDGAAPQTQGKTILLTGATGNLGTFVLRDLLLRSDVTKVYALVRAADSTAAQSRLSSALVSRQISLDAASAAKVIALPSDLSRPDLGLPEDVMSRLLTTLSHVIHSAWAVNFNLPISSFEAQHIRGTWNLVNVCRRVKLTQPAKFFFCSSISAASGHSKPASIAEETVPDLNWAQGTGYGRSKLVAEYITQAAMKNHGDSAEMDESRRQHTEQTGMISKVLRIGQLSGDITTAVWNETEAVALMIRSALSTGCLPALDEYVSWLPVDICAQAITELALSPIYEKGVHCEAEAKAEADADTVYHLVNPIRFHWTRDVLPALKQAKRLPAFEAVSPKDWLARLRKSDASPVTNPSIKLVDFWEKKYAHAGAYVGASSPNEPNPESADKGLHFQTTLTATRCPSLAMTNPHLDIIRQGHVKRYVEAWAKKWTATTHGPGL